MYSVAPTRADKQRGASALEYIVLAAVIVIAIITALTTTEIGSKITETFTQIVNQMPTPRTVSSAT
ncbi:Flp family type IVb pilin [Alcanivorax sp. IO_7]|nr:Flp family type IVb pilin [Alcanivorax sp. IO_7]